MTDEPLDLTTEGIKPNVNPARAIRTAQLTEQQIKAMRLFIAGATYEQIAKAAGYANRSNAHASIKAALTKRAAERDDLADVALTIQLERLEGLVRTHYPIAIDRNHKDNARSAGIVLQAMDRTAKFLGLDQPQRTEVTVVQRDELDHELAALISQFRGAAEERGIDVDTPVLDTIVSTVQSRDDDQ